MLFADANKLTINHTTSDIHCLPAFYAGVRQCCSATYAPICMRFSGLRFLLKGPGIKLPVPPQLLHWPRVLFMMTGCFYIHWELMVY